MSKVLLALAGVLLILPGCSSEDDSRKTYEFQGICQQQIEDDSLCQSRKDFEELQRIALEDTD